MVRVLGRGTLLAKVDLKSAYLVVPVHRDDWPLLAIQWERQTYLDTALPFGLRSAPKLFSAVADAVAWRMSRKGIRYQVHYLNDYLLLGPPETPVCGQDLATTLELCQSLGVPVAMEKLQGPSPTLVFLGIEIDTIRQQLRLPQDKLARLQSVIGGWVGRHACRRRQLQSLLGHLNHAAMVVRPGRTFLRRTIDCLSQTGHPDHFIRLNRQFHSDLLWWHTFLSHWYGVSTLRLPVPSTIVTSDASGNWGCGAFSGSQWFQLAWPDCWAEVHITAKELVPIVFAGMLWGQQWSEQSIQFSCDNMAVVACLKSGTSRHPCVMHLLQCLWFLSAFHQFSVTSQHLPGNGNMAADTISRNQRSIFLSLHPQANREPQAIPTTLVDLLLVSKPD